MTVVVHELHDLPPVASLGRLQRPVQRLEHLARRQAFLQVGKVVFHSAMEQAQAERALGTSFAESRVLLQDPAQFYVPAYAADQRTAREHLGLRPQAFMFLCIGLIAPTKGIHHAIEAFASIDAPDAWLVVAGAPSEQDPKSADYMRQVTQQAAEHPRVIVREGYLSDADFDAYLVSCDCVVLPYAGAFSSGVAARAKLFDRRCIVTAVGGLAAQMSDTDIVIGDVSTLGEAMRLALGTAPQKT